MPEKREGRVSKKRVAAGLAVLVIVWVGITGGIHYVWNKDDAGTIGDSFGAVNALFSALALGAIVYTLWQQQQDLRLQRKELQLQREELSKATEAHQDRNEIERELVRKRLSLDLVHEWSSDQMLRSRDRTIAYLREDTQESLFEGRISPISSEAIASKPAARETLRVLFFFERVYKLCASKNVDAKLLHSMLHQDSIEWSMRIGAMYERYPRDRQHDPRAVKMSEYLDRLSNPVPWDKFPPAQEW